MKEFTVQAMLTVSAWTKVEAETKEEAFRIAEQREVGSLCCDAIYPDDDEVWHFENDGMPQRLIVDID